MGKSQIESYCGPKQTVSFRGAMQNHQVHSLKLEFTDVHKLRCGFYLKNA